MPNLEKGAPSRQAFSPYSLRSHAIFLPLALAASILVLLWGASALFAENRALLGTKVVEAAAEQISTSTVVQMRVLWFIAAHVLLHCGLAVIIWFASWLVVRADPSRARFRTAVFWSITTLVLATVVLLNAHLFPRSVSGNDVRWLASLQVGSLSIAEIVASCTMVALASIVAHAVWRSTHRKAWLRATVWSVVAITVFSVWSKMPREPGVGASGSGDRPHVIVIGIDSLRIDAIGLAGRLGYTPALQNFLTDSQVFLDATTPLARTFPSWVTILSGRSPVVTNARDNLVPVESLNLGELLPDTLRRNGYRTYYATDEVRFANIDEQFGFDETITPRIGISDFVLGEFNDLPLANLLSGTVLARWLFPDSYANRAAARTYRPETFVAHVRDKLDVTGPTFLAVHLTLPHWPYHWADGFDSVFANTTDTAYAYLASLIAADRQFASLIEMLKRKGMLENAIVVVLSDHGEALQTPSDNLILGAEARRLAGKIPVWMNGHGTSVLSPHQYSVLVAFRGLGAARLPDRSALHSSPPLTLEDLAPTLLDLLGIDSNGGSVDGVSLASTLRGEPSDGDAPPLSSRVRFTETAFSPLTLQRKQVTAEGLLQDGDPLWLFGVNQKNGRFEARVERWPRLLALKERAAIGANYVLAAIPGERDDGHKYVLVPRRGGLPKRILAPPDIHSEPEAAQLWEALHARFGAELGPPIAD